MTLSIKRLMVTGANGFVGNALCKEALARGIDVIGVIRHQCQLSVDVENIAVGNIDAKINL